MSWEASNPATAVCRWCGETGLVTALTLNADNDLGRGFSLARCEYCEAWQVYPPLSPEFLRKYFSSPRRWETALDPDGREVDPFQRAENRRAEYEAYAGDLVAHLDRTARDYTMLDIGAGTGLFLSLLPDTLPKVALEPHPLAARVAAEKGLTVVEKWVEELHLPDDHLGALIFNQSLDHLHQPGAVLNRARHWLRPGGLMLISGLINPESWMARLYKNRFRLWHPLHQLYPTPSAMVRVLKVWGFEIIKWRQPYFNTPYGSTWKLLGHLPEVLTVAAGWKPRRSSPAWPGSTFTLLARKVLTSLKDRESEGVRAILRSKNVAPASSTGGLHLEKRRISSSSTTR